MPDIAFIIEMLDINFGSMVVESGTGSGSFSHSLARAVGKTGHLYSFDFHQARAEAAKNEFITHGLEGIVTSQCRDVCNDGFGLESIADAGSIVYYSSILKNFHSFSRPTLTLACH